MSSASLLFALIGLAGGVLAHGAPVDSTVLASNVTTKRNAAAARTVAAARVPLANNVPVRTTSTTGPGQTGYIHYFVITGPDGEPESQVGIELPGDRIAWSFPGLGVVISPFIQSGAITSNGHSYEVEHLYGMRPFSDERSLRALQQELWERVTPWVEANTPYCDEERPPNVVCVSCLGFVLRVLYPAPGNGLSALPVLPADFRSARKGLYTTEDLLLYLAGVRVDAPRHAQVRQIESLAVPEEMRQQLVRIATENDSIRTAARQSKPANAATAKPRGTARSSADLPKRVLQKRRS